MVQKAIGKGSSQAGIGSDLLLRVGPVPEQHVEPVAGGDVLVLGELLEHLGLGMRVERFEMAPHRHVHAEPRVDEVQEALVEIVKAVAVGIRLELLPPLLGLCVLFFDLLVGLWIGYT